MLIVIISLAGLGNIFTFSEFKKVSIPVVAVFTLDLLVLYDDLEELKHQSQKFNKDWVESNFKLLTALLEETKHEEGL